MEKPNFTKIYTKSPILVILIAGLMIGGSLAASVLYFMSSMSGNINVIESLYQFTLYSDPECTTELTEMSFSDIYKTVSGGNYTSDWFYVYLQLGSVIDDGDVFIHWLDTGAHPDATIAFQKYRYSLGTWDGSGCEWSTEILGSDCDGSVSPTSPLVGGLPVEAFRFKVTLDPAVELGSIEFDFSVYACDESLVVS